MGAVGKAAGSIGSGIANASTLGLFGSLTDGGDSYQQEGWDQAEDLRNLDAERKKLADQANDYRSKLPQEQDAQFQGANDLARRQLASQLRGVDQGSNRRGLLYSGLNQGAKTQANQQYASGLMNQRAQINQNTEAQAQALENRAIQAGLQQQSSRAKANAAKYGTDQARTQSNNGLLNNAIGGVGSVGGYFAGKS